MSEELAFAECDRLVREFGTGGKKPVKKRSSIYWRHRRGSGNSLCGFSCSDENCRPVAGATVCRCGS